MNEKDHAWDRVLGQARLDVEGPADVVAGVAVGRLEVQDVHGACLAVVVARVRVHGLWPPRGRVTPAATSAPKLGRPSLSTPAHSTTKLVHRSPSPRIAVAEDVPARDTAP